MAFPKLHNVFMSPTVCMYTYVACHENLVEVASTIVLYRLPRTSIFFTAKATLWERTVQKSSVLMGKVFLLGKG